jgi:hypothetical protein
MVSVFTRGIGWVDESISETAPVSANIGSYIYYLPIILPASCTVRRVWWANGATAAGDTFEAGIYADDGDAKPGARLLYGSAATSGTNSVQFVDVTDTIIGPGRYWLAWVKASGTSAIFRSQVSASDAVNAALMFHESGTTLPATATPGEPGQFYDHIPLFGFSTVASP